MSNIDAIERLVSAFTKLPAVGLKTATRFAYAVIDMEISEVEGFARSLLSAKNKVHFCEVCGNYTDEKVCYICTTRDSSIICVVESPTDVIALEKIKEYNGVYHVLHGVLNPKRGIGVEQLHMRQLMSRLVDVQEVIVATNSDVEGEVTATYIARQIKPLGINVTRIARGLPADSHLEYVDEVTLARAMNDRKPL